uniref:Uncharacterized protein n=1 Tax=Ralstonia syzygii R24 TaxID=907261 RepID=G3A524_9RALS|nr:hypothetical protein RALSY_30803 [Ralstonia syzygii R24]
MIARRAGFPLVCAMHKSNTSLSVSHLRKSRSRDRLLVSAPPHGVRIDRETSRGPLPGPGSALPAMSLEINDLAGMARSSL